MVVAYEKPIISFIVWSRFVNSRPLLSQSTGSSSNLFVYIEFGMVCDFNPYPPELNPDNMGCDVHYSIGAFYVYFIVIKPILHPYMDKEETECHKN